MLIVRTSDCSCLAMSLLALVLLRSTAAAATVLGRRLAGRRALAAGLRAALVEERRHPRQRAIPVDGDLVGRPGLDVVYEALGRRAAIEARRLDVGILEA